MREQKVVFDRSAQLNTLAVHLDTSVTAAMDAQVAIADIVLALLTKADALCEIAEATGADRTQVAAAMGRDVHLTSTEGVTQ